MVRTARVDLSETDYRDHLNDLREGNDLFDEEAPWDTSIRRLGIQRPSNYSTRKPKNKDDATEKR